MLLSPCKSRIQCIAQVLTRNSGASPIMSPYGEEATDLCKFDGALLINMGTLNSESVSNYLKAIKAYNVRGNPVIYDPVGAAATEIRRDAVSQLMAGGYFDLIKGNEGEIRQVWGSNAVQQRGVDSGPSTLDGQQKALLTRDLARRERKSFAHIDIFCAALIPSQGMSF